MIIIPNYLGENDQIITGGRKDSKGTNLSFRKVSTENSMETFLGTSLKNTVKNRLTMNPCLPGCDKGADIVQNPLDINLK